MFSNRKQRKILSKKIDRMTMLPLCDKYFPEIFPSFFGSYHVWRFLTEGRVEWEILADFYEETNLEDFYHFEITYNKKKKQWIIVNPSYTGIYGSVFSRSLSQRWWRRNGHGKIFFLQIKPNTKKCSTQVSTLKTDSSACTNPEHSFADVHPRNETSDFVLLSHKFLLLLFM